MLQATTHFHPVLKESLLKQGLDRFFVLDGVGALLGVPPGGNRGGLVEISRELSSYCAADGVHYTETGYANLAKTILKAVCGVSDGTITKTRTDDKGNISGKARSQNFFWRGFCSPVGARLSVHSTLTDTRHSSTAAELHRSQGQPPRGHMRGGGQPLRGDKRVGGDRGRWPMEAGRGQRPHKYYHHPSYYPY
jgi:hypothetical protein